MNVIIIIGIWRNDSRTMWSIGPLSNHSKWWDWCGMSSSNKIYKTKVSPSDIVQIIVLHHFGYSRTKMSDTDTFLKSRNNKYKLTILRMDPVYVPLTPSTLMCEKLKNILRVCIYKTAARAHKVSAPSDICTNYSIASFGHSWTNMLFDIDSDTFLETKKHKMYGPLQN